MDIILLQRIEKLGTIGDVVSVKDGYARNFLVPEGLAVAAIGGIAAQAEAMQRKRDLRSVAERADAERVAGRIAGVVLQVTAKASEEGRLFGSVGTAEVVEALAAQIGLEVDRRQVHGEIAKDVGVHEFTVQLHPEVAVPVDVEVRAED